MKKIAFFIVLQFLIFSSALADDIPEYEGVYARTNSGSLINLGKGYPTKSIPEVSFQTSTICDRCIALTMYGPKLKTFPPGEYRDFPLVEIADVKGFVVKQRFPVQQIFLDRLGEIKDLTDGVLLPEDPSKLQLGRNYAFVHSASLNGRYTELLNSSAYTFRIPRRLPQNNYEQFAPSDLPPFLSFSNCGWSSKNDPVKTKLIDQFTTEFVFGNNYFKGIDATFRKDRCGDDGHAVRLYGWVLRVGDTYYPFMAKQEYNRYLSKFGENWGPIIRGILQVPR